MAAVLILSFAFGKNDDAVSKFLGIVLVTAAVNYFAVTRLFSKDKKIQNTSDKSSNNKRYVNQSIKIVPKISGFKQNRLSDNESAATMALYRSEIDNSGCFNTVILGKRTGNVPFLQSLSNPMNKIIIDKNSILIGRLQGSVDYVIDNRAVGKIHAEIVNKGEEYYIIDLIR